MAGRQVARSAKARVDTTWPRNITVAAVAVAVVLALAAPARGGRRSAQPTPSSGSAIRPFTIAISDAVLKDLRERLARARFPDQLVGAGWTYGMNLEYLQRLVTYWREQYDWRAQERRLNRMPQFKTTIDGLDIHFVHRRSAEPGALPIMLIHGWPGTFYEFHKMVEPLADPRGHGGAPQDAFHVVVVSLPGFGFSERPSNMGHSRERTARIFIELMKRLGYTRYGVQAGDVGYSIAALMALNDPDGMAGLHLNRCAAGDPPDPANRDAGLTPEEIRLRDKPRFGPDERGYSEIQGTKPQTLGYALNDSPVGLAAWIVEKYRTWCDCNGDPENVFTRDELLNTVMIYWVTQTATSAARYYYEGRHLREPPYAPLRARVTVPTGCTAFPGELGFTPRSWAEKYFNVTRFTIMPRGGHFAALEQPMVLTGEVRAFFRELR
jgi:pimeloyl-ACP methyl ester carboxylesterase